ncbi:MAG TPA: hypothetical protein VGE45_09575 [Chloroflexia bacterium]
MDIVLAGVAKGYFGLALIDAFAGAVAVGVPVASDVARAVLQAATLAARIEVVRAVMPAAEGFFVVAALGLFAALDLGGVGLFFLELALVCSPAQPAHRGFHIAMPPTEVTATDYALGRRGTNTYGDWTFTS